jgi:hypothetical protein
MVQIPSYSSMKMKIFIETHEPSTPGKATLHCIVEFSTGE